MEVLGPFVPETAIANRRLRRKNCYPVARAAKPVRKICAAQPGRARFCLGVLAIEIHALVDADGNPIALKLSGDHSHCGRSAADLLGTVEAGQILLADRGYDSDVLRAAMVARGASANIKPIPNRVNVPAFRAWLYRYRNVGERFFSKLNHFRTIAIRFERHDANYVNLIKVAASRFRMRFMGR